MEGSACFVQAPSYMQQTRGGSAAPENAIPAQHALGLLHASSAHASSYSSSLAQDLMQPHTAVLNHQTDMNSTSRVQGLSHLASNWAFNRGTTTNSPCSGALGDENLVLGLTPHCVTSSEPQTAPDATSTGGKSDNAYVSFDEWRAQVHAKLISTGSDKPAFHGNAGLPHCVHDQQPLSWL